MKITKPEINKVLSNHNTKVLIEWLGATIKYSQKYVMSTQFFHQSHSKKDRTIILYLLKQFFAEIDNIEMTGPNSVLITLK